MSELYGTVQNGGLVLLAAEDKLKELDGQRVLVSISSIDSYSTGQMNLLRYWLRLMSEATGMHWRRIYDEACFLHGQEKDPRDLNREEIEQVLRELEGLASDMEIIIPFPTKWDRKPKMYGIG